MGISVSVDSWVQQAIEELSQKSYTIEDPIYGKLISAASFPAEIFVIEPIIFEKLMLSQVENVKNILIVCLENLFSNETQTRLNSAALLTRMFPYMCMKGYPINFETYILGSIKVFDETVAPGAEIVSTTMEFLSQLQLDDPEAILTELDGNIASFDLTILTVFILSECFNNLTLYHQLIVSASKYNNHAVLVLFHYVHNGGRQISLITLLTLLMFHPTHEFLNLSESFVKNGGNLSSQLLKIKNDETDLFCYLCSLAFHDKTPPALNVDDPDILRVGLMRLMQNPEISIDPYQIQTVYNKTHSNIGSALLSRFINLPQEITNTVPILKDYIFDDPIQSKSYNAWIMKTLPQMYLYQKTYLFKGTSLTFPKPNFEMLDHFVTTSV